MKGCTGTQNRFWMLLFSPLNDWFLPSKDIAYTLKWILGILFFLIILQREACISFNLVNLWIFNSSNVTKGTYYSLDYVFFLRNVSVGHSTEISETTVGCIPIKFNVPRRPNPSEFSDCFTFPLAPPAGWHLRLWVKCHNSYWMDCNEIWYRL